MKTLKEANQELIEFDKKFNNGDCEHCVERALLLLKCKAEQMVAKGYEWPFNSLTYSWACRRAILNRPMGQTMMAAAIGYVESIERQAEEFYGVVR